MSRLIRSTYFVLALALGGGLAVLAAPHTASASSIAGMVAAFL